MFAAVKQKEIVYQTQKSEKWMKDFVWTMVQYFVRDSLMNTSVVCFPSAFSRSTKYVSLWNGKSFTTAPPPP